MGKAIRRRRFHRAAPWEGAPKQPGMCTLPRAGLCVQAPQGCPAGCQCPVQEHSCRQEPLVCSAQVSYPSAVAVCEARFSCRQGSAQPWGIVTKASSTEPTSARAFGSGRDGPTSSLQQRAGHRSGPRGRGATGQNSSSPQLSSAPPSRDRWQQPSPAGGRHSLWRLLRHSDAQVLPLQRGQRAEKGLP